jgi:hypothetical protein
MSFDIPRFCLGVTLVLLVFQLYWWLKFSQFFCDVIDCFCGNPAGATIGAAHHLASVSPLQATDKSVLNGLK